MGYGVAGLGTGVSKCTRGVVKNDVPEYLGVSTGVAEVKATGVEVNEGNGVTGAIGVADVAGIVTGIEGTSGVTGISSGVGRTVGAGRANLGAVAGRAN